MADRSNQPAALRRRAELAEARYEAEKEAHAKAFAIYREQLHELVDLRMRMEAAVRAINGEGGNG